MPAIDINELTPQAQELLSQIEPGEELLVTSENQTVAKIIRINGQEKPKRRRAGMSDSVIWISPDFDEPLEDFAEYMP